jgi:hypothetical protein
MGKRLTRSGRISVCRIRHRNALQTQNTDQQSNAEQRLQHDAPISSNLTTQKFTTVINDFLRPHDAQIESTMVNNGLQIPNLLVKTCLVICRTLY